VFIADCYEGGRFARRCAVKILKQLDPSRVDRFRNEVRILKDLAHERIAAYYSEGELALPKEHHGPGGQVMPWVAMDLGGDNLRRTLDESGPFSGDRFVNAAQDMCDGLGYLHGESIIHRDVKPENFVFDTRSSDRIKMIDFGIAKYIGEDVAGRPFDNFTKMTEFVGPQAFSSPELLAYARDKKHPVDFRSDLFQLGKVMWFLATGVVSAGVPSRRADPFGGTLHGLVTELLADDPRERPQTAAEVRAALAKL
jgi:serine/threonine protein kinase